MTNPIQHALAKIIGDAIFGHVHPDETPNTWGQSMTAAQNVLAEIVVTAAKAQTPAPAPRVDDFLDVVASIRDEYSKKRQDALDQMEMFAAQGDTAETSINSTEAERHAASALSASRILKIAEAFFDWAGEAPPPAPQVASTSPFLASLSPDQRTIHDALCDSSYLAGAKAAWNASCEENPVTAREKFDALVKSRDGYLKEYSAALAALADAETAKAIRLGAAVLAGIEDPEARERCIRSALTVASQKQAPAPHLVGPDEDTARIRAAAKVLLTPDSEGNRTAIYDACGNRVKVYKFDGVLRALAATEGQNNG